MSTSSEPDFVPLHQELQEALVDHDEIGQMIHHPLLIETVYSPARNAHLNKILSVRKQCLESFLEHKNWTAYISMHEKPYRPQALEDLVRRHNLSDEAYWENVREIVVLSENAFEWQSALERLLSARQNRHLIMSREDRDAFSKLPDLLRIYRGSAQREWLSGFSWTLSLDVAKRLARTRGGTIYLATADIPKSEVIAYLSSRDEEEILVFPSKVMPIAAIDTCSE